MLEQVLLATTTIAIFLAAYALYSNKRLEHLQSQSIADIEEIKKYLTTFKLDKEVKANYQQIVSLQSKLNEIENNLKTPKQQQPLSAPPSSPVVVTSTQATKEDIINKRDMTVKLAPKEAEQKIEELSVLSVDISHVANSQLDIIPLDIQEPKNNDASIKIEKNDYLEPLKKAVNDVLLQQGRLNNNTIIESLKKYMPVEGLTLKTLIYYLDGTPSDALAELVIILLEGKYYVVPHSNSLSNPYLSVWFDTEQGQQVAIKHWPQVIYHQETFKIECVSKGILTV